MTTSLRIDLGPSLCGRSSHKGLGEGLVVHEETGEIQFGHSGEKEQRLNIKGVLQTDRGNSSEPLNHQLLLNHIRSRARLTRHFSCRLRRLPHTFLRPGPKRIRRRRDLAIAKWGSTREANTLSNDLNLKAARLRSRIDSVSLSLRLPLKFRS